MLDVNKARNYLISCKKNNYTLGDSSNTYNHRVLDCSNDTSSVLNNIEYRNSGPKCASFPYNKFEDCDLVTPDDFANLKMGEIFAISQEEGPVVSSSLKIGVIGFDLTTSEAIVGFYDNDYGYIHYKVIDKGVLKCVSKFYSMPSCELHQVIKIEESRMIASNIREILLNFCSFGNLENYTKYISPMYVLFLLLFF